MDEDKKTAAAGRDHEASDEYDNCTVVSANPGVLDKLPPRLAFWAGVVVTAGIIFAIGFVALLILIMKGYNFGGSTTGTTVKPTTPTVNSNVAVANANVNADTANAAAAVSGSIDVAALRNIRGQGDYTIVEYSDTECPFCKRFHPTMKQVVEAYSGKVQWVYKHLPLTSLHSKAQREAMATECAGEQNKFWEYLDLLFERTTSNDSLPDEQLFTMADDVGLDRTKFDDCLKTEKFKDVINADSAEAQKLGGRGTPYGVIIDKSGNVIGTIEGALPYDSIAAKLDSLIK